MRALYAVDLGENEDDVADHLGEGRLLLERLGATVELLFVDTCLSAVSGPSDIEEMAPALACALARRDEAQRARLGVLLGGWPPERRGQVHLAHERSAADEIVAQAAGYDLVVVGTDGRLGSVAEKVVRSSPVPVLIVRERGSASSESGDTRILAAVDIWEPAAEILVAEASRWAARLHARLDLIHVVTPVSLDPSAVAGAAGGTDPAALLRDAEQFLAHLGKRLPAELCGKVRVECGPPSSAVVAAAAGYGLLLVGTHRRPELGRLWFGSVAERTVRLSPGPVLVVPTGA